MTRSVLILTLATLAVLNIPFVATAQERLCDTQYEDCRAPILELIRNERVGIDVAFWFMSDSRYVTELVNRHKAGVPVRVLVDQRANNSKPHNATILQMLRDGGVPMRERYVGDILHFKMMLFHGQNVLQFSKANYTPLSFVPETPNVSYMDEAIFFTNDNTLTNSFRRRFDDLWVDTSYYRNYANITTPLSRACPDCTIHPSMNFPPLQDFSNRSVSRYDRETQRIDVVVFRVTDHRHADGMIRAVARGVPVRLITEPDEYRNPARLWHAKHVDRMWAGGVQMKHRRHSGNLHQASVVMHGLGEVIFGSSNWTTASASWQDEHNYFYNPTLGKPSFFQWFADQFERKWNDTTNYVPFTPLPPNTPVYSAPVNGASGQSSSVTLRWDGGTWAHLYDIYFGTTPEPPLIATNQELGSPVSGQVESYAVTNLLPGTTYYWRIVGKTWANRGTAGPTWSFTTAGTPPSGGGGGGSTSLAYGGTAAPIPGYIQAENFDTGGAGVSYYDTKAGNSGGVYRVTDVDIQATTDAGGGYSVGWTKTGEWLKYSVNVTTSGVYTLETRVANVGAGATFRVEVDGADRTGPIAVPDTGAWDAWQTVRTPGISLSAGAHVLRVVFGSMASGGAVGGFNWFRFVESTSPSSTSAAYGGTPVAVPGIVQAENFDIGAQGDAYYDTTAGNKGGAYRSTDVDIQSTTDVGGGYSIGWTKTGEWLKYTVNVTSDGTYALETRLANIGTGATFHVEVDGVDRTGAIAVPDTGAWDAWQTITTPGIRLTAGQHVVRVVMGAMASGGAVAGFNWFRFVEDTTSASNSPVRGTSATARGMFHIEDRETGAQDPVYHGASARIELGTYASTDHLYGTTERMTVTAIPRHTPVECDCRTLAPVSLLALTRPEWPARVLSSSEMIG